MLHVVRGGEEGKCQGLKEGVARGELGSRKWRQKKGMAETTGDVIRVDGVEECRDDRGIGAR